MSAADSIDDLMEPLGAPGWADQVAADSRSDDDRFVLTDDRTASWALRKRAKSAARIAAINADVDERIAILEDHRERATASDRHTVEFMDGLVKDYARRELEADPDRKTITLPEGRIKSRTTSPSVVVADATELADWLMERGRDDLYVVEPKVAGVRDLRKVFEAAGEKVVDPESGEVVPGLSVREGSTTFTVDTDGGA